MRVFALFNHITQFIYYEGIPHFNDEFIEHFTQSKSTLIDQYLLSQVRFGKEYRAMPIIVLKPYKCPYNYLNFNYYYIHENTSFICL